MLGLFVGIAVGNNDGITVGYFEGISVGLFVGIYVGLCVGNKLGINVGNVDGSTVGCIVGSIVCESIIKQMQMYFLFYYFPIYSKSNASICTVSPFCDSFLYPCHSFL